MKKTSIKENYFYSILYNILTVILPLFTGPYIARVIGVSGIGIYSYNSTIANYFATFSLLGISFYGNRSIAAVKDDRQKCSTIFSEIYSLQVICGIICLLLYYIYVLFFVKEDIVITMVLSLSIFTAMVNVSWFFNGLEMFRLTVIRNIIIKCVTVVSILLFVKTKDDLLKYVIIICMGTFFSEGYLLIHVRKYIDFHFPSWRRIIPHLKPNLILFIPIISVSLYRSIDKVIIKGLSSYDEVGYYANAEKIIGICLSCITALGQVMLPKMSYLAAKGDRKSFDSLLKKSFQCVSMLSIAMTIGIIAVAHTFIPVFLGAGYEKCIPISQLLSLNLVLLAWNNVIKSEILIPQKKDKIYIVSVLCGAAINITIDFILIPKYLSIGAVIGTIAAELVSLLIMVAYTRKEVSYYSMLYQTIPYIVIGLLMLGCVRIVDLFNLNVYVHLIVQIAVGVCVYGVLTLIYLVKKKDELGQTIIQIFKRKRLENKN